MKMKRNAPVCFIILISVIITLFACNKNNNPMTVYMTNESGERVTDENGEQITLAPLTAFAPERDDKGNLITDSNGETKTSLIEIPNTRVITKENVEITADGGEAITDYDGMPVTYNITEPRDFVVIEVTNKKGEKVTEKNGEAATLKLPIPTEPITVFVPITDSKGEEVTDKNGEKLTEQQTLPENTLPEKVMPVDFVKTFGGSLNDHFSDVIALKDGNILVLNISVSYDKDLSNAAKEHKTPISSLIKYSPSGEVLWQKAYGGDSGLTLEKVFEAGDGSILAVGFSKSTNLASQNKGDYDAVVLRLDKDGNELYLKTFGGSLSDMFYGLCVKDSVFYALGTTFSKSGDFGGLADSGAAVFAKFNLADGSLIFSKCFGSNGDYFKDLFIDSNNNVFCVGVLSQNSSMFTSRGKSDCFVMKLDQDGNTLFSTRIGGSGTELFTAITRGLNGGCVIAGNSDSMDGDFQKVSNRGRKDAFVIKLDENGKIEWIGECRGLYDDNLVDIVTLDDSYMAAGFSNSNNRNLINCGNRGGSDAVIASFNTYGQLQMIESFGGTYDDKFTSFCVLEDSIFAVGSSLSDNMDMFSLSPSSNTQYTIGILAKFTR